MKFGRIRSYLEESSHCTFSCLTRILRPELREERNLKQGSWTQYKAAEIRVRRFIKSNCALKEDMNYIKV
jgi:hypothetical protein